MTIASKVNPLLTVEYIQTETENKYFDRKSGKSRVAELAADISAFANADGGTLVIGISDKKRTLEGVNACGDEKINDFLNAPKDCCRPMPRYQEEFIDIINDNGKPDRLLLLHIEASVDQIIPLCFCRCAPCSTAWVYSLTPVRHQYIAGTDAVVGGCG